MKKILMLSFLFTCLKIWGQIPNTEVLPKNKFSFYENNTLFTASTDGKTVNLGENLKIKNSKKYNTSNYYTYSIMPKDVLESMPISEGMGFYSALKSPNDINTWVFIERNIEDTSYNFCSFDFDTKTKKILFSENESPNPNHAFNPFAWSKVKDEIYIQALVFGSLTDNEGIWSYNFTTKKFTKLLVSKSYLITPIISEDSKLLIYTGTLEQNKNNHSDANIVFLYDIEEKQEIVIAKNEKSSFSVDSWIEENISNTDLINLFDKDNTSKKGVK